MPSFGEKLKLEREKRKVTLEQISASTKIGTRMLQALEEDKFSQLPGGIFNKGFVRAYSRCLGLDEDQTVTEYLQASGDAPPERTEIAVREDQGPEDIARENQEHLRRLEASSNGQIRQLPWGLFAAVLLVVTLALSLWSRRQRERVTQPLHPPAATTTALPARGTSSTTSGSATSGSLGSASQDSPSQNLAPAAPGEFTVVVQAREECWISITADGKTADSELLSAGSERTVRGQKEVIVKAGNAGAVDFQFNGKKLETGAKYGDVKTVTFGPGGMVPLAPAPHATP